MLANTKLDLAYLIQQYKYCPPLIHSGQRLLSSIKSEIKTVTLASNAKICLIFVNASFFTFKSMERTIDQRDIDILQRAIAEREGLESEKNEGSTLLGVFFIMRPGDDSDEHKIVSIPLDDGLINLLEPYEKPVMCVGRLIRFGTSDLWLSLIMSGKNAAGSKMLYYQLSIKDEHLRHILEEDYSSIILRGIIPDVPSASKLSFRRPPLSIALDTANEKRDQIAGKYNVKVELLDTDQEYYSDAALQRSIVNDTYFISKENPILTAQITEHLIKYAHLKNKSLLEMANTKRFEKADDTSSQLSKRIDEVKQVYRSTHQGKDPSLNKTADLLNEHNQHNSDKIIPPQGGVKWYAQTVKRILERTKIER